MSTVPNAPAGLPPVAINPTLNGATFSGDPNAPAGLAPAAGNPTLDGADLSGVANAPLSQLPATAAAVIDWTPNTGPQATIRSTSTDIQQSAGILAADGSIVTGSGGPPYVVGNVTVNPDTSPPTVGTNVILTPTP